MHLIQSLPFGNKAKYKYLGTTKKLTKLADIRKLKTYGI